MNPDNDNDDGRPLGQVYNEDLRDELAYFDPTLINMADQIAHDRTLTGRWSARPWAQAQTCAAPPGQTADDVKRKLLEPDYSGLERRIFELHRYQREIIERLEKLGVAVSVLGDEVIVSLNSAGRQLPSAAALVAVLGDGRAQPAGDRIDLVSSRRMGKVVAAELFEQGTACEWDPPPKQPIQHGPQRKGKGGKARRW